MQTIGNLWWLWLIGLVVFGGYSLYNQITRMKRMVGSVRRVGVGGISRGDDFEDEARGFTSGLGLFAVSSGLTSGCLILLLISVIVNIFMKK